MSVRLAILLLFIAFTVGVPRSGAGEERYGNLYNAVYVRNRDADTIVFNIPGVHPLLGREIEVQLRGLDIPALAGSCRQEAELAGQARDVVQLLLSRARTIVLANVGRGRFFRIKATVLADDRDIRQVLIAKGLARRASAGQHPDWCE